MSNWLVFWIILLCPMVMAGCKTTADKVNSRRESQVSAKDGPRTLVGGHNVVVKGNAWLYTAPDMDAPRFRLFALDTEIEPWKARRYTLAADKGAWVVLETEIEQTGCLEGLSTYPFNLYLYAKKDDLLLVSTQKVTQKFGDGTSLILAPGVPIGPPRSSDGKRRVELGEALFFTEVQEDVLGYSFLVDGPFSESDAEFTYASFVREGVVPVFDDDEPFHILSNDDHYLAVHDLEKQGGESFIHFDSPCFSIRVKFGNEDLQYFGMGAGGLGGKGRSPWFDIAKGQNVYWHNETKAGVVLNDMQLSIDHTKKMNGLTCKKFVAGDEEHGPEEERTYHICFSPEQTRPDRLKGQIKKRKESKFNHFLPELSTEPTSAKYKRPYCVGAFKHLEALRLHVPHGDRTCRSNSEKCEKCKIPAAAYEFIASAEKANKHCANDERRPLVLYSLGRTYYEFNYYDEAMTFFKIVVSSYPEHTLSIPASNYILDIFNVSKEWDGLYDHLRFREEILSNYHPELKL